jgi:hypothetical protein
MPMSPHELAATTQSLEMTQIQQINQHLAKSGARPQAQDLGLAGVVVHPEHVDAVAAHRAHLPAHLAFLQVTVDTLAPGARLVQLVAAGSPTFPYIYGLFTDTGTGATNPTETDARLLPVTLHTESLRKISARYRLRHCWGA